MQDRWGNPGQVSAMQIEETRRTAKDCKQRGLITAVNLEVFEKVKLRAQCEELSCGLVRKCERGLRVLGKPNGCLRQGYQRVWYAYSLIIMWTSAAYRSL
ncbi:hypothetical protein PAXINDRAFT_97205 [Paxillus involutus ATCC 200175]|nr:hypothetical protein PAXINDRAFT_97205 [Paxillus involutus ATCC 200175]